jgi:hypothetical protein
MEAAMSVEGSPYGTPQLPSLMTFRVAVTDTLGSPYTEAPT